MPLPYFLSQTLQPAADTFSFSPPNLSSNSFFCKVDTPPTVPHLFPKSERLHRKKLIKLLFDQGKSYNFFPIKLIYLRSPEILQTQALFTIPKRNFKKAVDRNRIKRQMREAYRLHKHRIPYSPDKDVHFLLAYIYIARKQHTYQDIELKIKVSLDRLTKVKP